MRRLRLRTIARLLLCSGCFALAAFGCSDDDDPPPCANGHCFCPAGASCQLPCLAPPCHITCDTASECVATCANGTCRCENGSSCNFTCAFGPCHVQCAGQNQSCDGECANGSCSCGPNSTCRFSCKDDNCHASCAAGSTCVLECPNGRAGEQGCTIDDCAAGAPVVCADGRATVCGASCPI